MSRAVSGRNVTLCRVGVQLLPGWRRGRGRRRRGGSCRLSASSIRSASRGPSASRTPGRRGRRPCRRRAPGDRPRRRDRARLPRACADELLGSVASKASFLIRRSDDDEGNAQLLQDCAPLWRSGGEKRWAARRKRRSSASAAARLPNQSPISRWADSGESEPWTRLSGIESERSPRIVPGRLRRGSSRQSSSGRLIASSPSTTTASSGRRDEVDELAEERLLRVLGVVLLGEGRSTVRSGGAQLEPSPLQPSHDLAQRVGAALRPA